MIASPGIFWSDVVLGATTLILGLRISRQSTLAGFIFIFAAISAWVGAGYHAFIGTTDTPIGKIAWMITLISLAASAAVWIRLSLGRRITWMITISLIGYSIFALIKNEDFTWVALIVNLAACIYGLTLVGSNAIQATQHFVAYVMISIVSALITIPGYTLGFAVSPLTIFHILEIPATIFLFLSINQYLKAHQ